MSIKIVLVTNGPAPYRIPALNKAAATPGIRLHVIFCCKREPNRGWNLPSIEFDCTYLRERITTVRGRYIHNNPDVLAALRRQAPDVVITDGFNPTHLYAFAYSWLKRLKHVTMTDGTFDSEMALSGVHRAVRRFVYARSHAFVSAAMGGKKLYESYGIAGDRCFRACLCVKNSDFGHEGAHQNAPFDFIFCGRIEPVKAPLFALDVALEAARRLSRKVKILFVGSGSQEQQVRDQAARYSDLLETKFHGFARQDELPALYRSARVFLFPSLTDPWGVVANEACASGLPVLVSPHAGVAGELVLDGENGYVCALDVKLWAERAIVLLTRPDLYHDFSERSRLLVSDFTFDDAARGIVTACRFATSHKDTSLKTEELPLPNPPADSER
jgi:glycosyltransferase involved in cell wall biosynthesis